MTRSSASRTCASVREGGGTPAAERMMQQILDSAIAYERVQVFARKRQFDEALELMHIDPGDDEGRAGLPRHVRVHC